MTEENHTKPNGEAVDVSVLIAVHNRGPWLEKSLKSLGAQDLDAAKFEVVVADYGQPEGSRRAISAALAETPKLQVSHLEMDGFAQPYNGLTRARNAAIRSARGWLLAFLPPECLLTPAALRLCVDVHAQSGLDLVTTVRPWFVSERATAELDKAEWRRDAATVRETFSPEDVSRPDKDETWGDMHFGAVKKKWACWVCGHNERFRAWGYESVDFTERLTAFAVEYAELTDERVACFHLWHPPGEGHGNRREAIIERLLNSLSRAVLLKHVRGMDLLPRSLNPTYDDLIEFLRNLPAITLNRLLARADEDYNVNILPRLVARKHAQRPGSEGLGDRLWPGLAHAVQWGDHGTAIDWVDLLAREAPDDPAPLVEKAKIERLQTSGERPPKA